MMDVVLSAAGSDLVTRTIVEEVDGRRITNRGMLLEAT
nr:unnamed protein product [Digitaria exilis]